MEEFEDGHNDSENRKSVKRPSKIRDIFTDRIVGIVGGAFVPLVLLFIPLINKYLDHTKEIQTLQIQNNTDDIEATNKRVEVLTQALVGSQIQLQSLTDKLAMSIAELKKATESLAECQRSCDSYCQTLIGNQTPVGKIKRP